MDSVWEGGGGGAHAGSRDMKVTMFCSETVSLGKYNYAGTHKHTYSNI